MLSASGLAMSLILSIDFRRHRNRRSSSPPACRTSHEFLDPSHPLHRSRCNPMHGCCMHTCITLRDIPLHSFPSYLPLPLPSALSVPCAFASFCLYNRCHLLPFTCTFSCAFAESRTACIEPRCLSVEPSCSCVKKRPNVNNLEKR